MSDYIIIYDKGNMYKIEKDPFEVIENVYKRGWFIINNHEKIKNNKELISMSFIYVNELKNNMTY